MPMPAESGFTTAGDTDMQITLRKIEDIDAAIEDSDKFIALIQHMDLISIGRLRDIIEKLEAKSKDKYAVLLYKKAGEKEYKISCIECGQKIWIPDEGTGAKARCPKCRKSFEILDRKDHLSLLIKAQGNPPVGVVEKGSKPSFDDGLRLVVTTQQNGSTETAAPSGRPKIVLKKRS